MKQYEKYKSSGVEWITDIPIQWERTKLKHLVETKITDGPHETPEMIPEGIPFLSAESIKENKLDFNARRGNISRELFDLYNKKSRVKKDDILFCKSGSTTGKSAMVETDDEFSIWSPLAIIRGNKKKVNQKYLFHFIQSREFQTQVQIFWSFGTQPNIGMSTIENLHISFPVSVEEQTSIANFLDEKTAQIDKLISNKQNLIELLKEEQSSLIKDSVSGIKKNWERVKVKHIANVVLGKMLTNDDKGGFLLKPYLRAANMKWLTVDVSSIKEMWFSPKELEKLRVKKFDLLVSEGGEVGRTCIWQDELDECYIQNSVHKITFNQNQNPFFFLYQFYYMGSIGYFESIVNRISIGHLTGEKLNDVFVSFPPLKEQTAIVEHIQTETQRIDNLISKTEKEIELMNEYRTALISEVVTGKIKVN